MLQRVLRSWLTTLGSAPFLAQIPPSLKLRRASLEPAVAFGGGGSVGKPAPAFPGPTRAPGLAPKFRRCGVNRAAVVTQSLRPVACEQKRSVEIDHTRTLSD